jgi:thioredoxin 2
MSTVVACSDCGAKNRIADDKRHLVAKCAKCGNGLTTPEGVVELDDQNFHTIVSNSSLPVLVDFYSPTCGPCHALAPVIVQMARQYAGRVVVCKLDTSRHQISASRFQIKGVPTLIFFKGGKQVDQVVGAVPAQELEKRLDKLLF